MKGKGQLQNPKREESGPNVNSFEVEQVECEETQQTKYVSTAPKNQKSLALVI